MSWKNKILLLALATAAAAQINEIAADRIRAHVKFLASDLLEGRGPGTRGDQLATEYLATQFALLGAKPAGENGTYFQRVPLVGVQTGDAAELSATAAGGGKISFAWLKEFVGSSDQQLAESRPSGDAIFVGHG